MLPDRTSSGRGEPTAGRAQRATAAGAPARRGLRGASEWACVGLVALAAGFVPLLAAGAFDDFLRCLRTVAYGSDYNRATPATVLSRLYVQLSGRLNGLAVPAAIVLLSARPGAAHRRQAWVVVVAMAGLFPYGPLSPNHFPHYQVPFEAAFAVAACLLAGLIVEAGGRADVRLTALLLLFGLVGLRKPDFVTIKGDYDDRVVQYRGRPYVLHRKEYGISRAVGFLRSGTLPAGNPPGFRDGFRPYPWDDLRGVILYLRGHTPADTPVANLALDCAAAIAGVVPRPSALPADGFSLVNFPGPSLGPELTAIEAAGPRVVVWNPATAEADFPKFAPIWKAVREHYRPEARFGDLEVWRRRP